MIDMIMMTVLQAYPMYICAIPVILGGVMIRTRRRKKTGEKKIYLETLAFVLLCLSILLILAATCYSNEFFELFNLSNLSNLKEVHFDPSGFLQNILLISLAGSFHATINWVGNMVLFVPIGFFSMWISRINTHIKMKIVISCMIFSIVIELTQLCYGRLADVMDVVLNTTGGFIGCELFTYIMSLTENLKGRYKQVNKV
ncbi:Predicted integral membrane protein [uncultured Eubacterium sp.]|uniref:VanZ family protein n=1 Tax=Emergencia sp. TaxID=1926557 RepID=UPI0008227980|nr:Predicted integral membrane protein [uncultured Eubacterium sp.]